MVVHVPRIKHFFDIENFWRFLVDSLLEKHENSEKFCFFSNFQKNLKILKMFASYFLWFKFQKQLENSENFCFFFFSLEKLWNWWLLFLFFCIKFQEDGHLFCNMGLHRPRFERNAFVLTVSSCFWWRKGGPVATPAPMLFLFFMVVLCCVVPCCTVLCCVVLCCVWLGWVAWDSSLHVAVGKGLAGANGCRIPRQLPCTIGEDWCLVLGGLQLFSSSQHWAGETLRVIINRLDGGHGDEDVTEEDLEVEVVVFASRFCFWLSLAPCWPQQARPQYATPQQTPQHRPQQATPRHRPQQATPQHRPRRATPQPTSWRAPQYHGARLDGPITG